MKPVWLCAMLLLLCGGFADANNLRQISSREGISNNAVLSLCQDTCGYVWIGTCDGLNLWDGRQMKLFPVDWGTDERLSGNLIERIARTDDGLFWVYSNYGLDLFDPSTRQVERHGRFQGYFRFATSTSDKVLVLTPGEGWYRYDPFTRDFRATAPPEAVTFDDCIDLSLGADDVLTLFTRTGIDRYALGFPDGEGELGWTLLERIPAPNGIAYAFPKAGRTLLIDREGVLYEYDDAAAQFNYIASLRAEIARRGTVSSVIRDGSDYLVSFFTDGVVRLRALPASRERYAVEALDIACGVFSLLRDERQEIVWIGTDGHGLFQLTKGPIAFRSLTFDQLPYQLSKPVRALHVDRDGTLWLGTKGEGIVRLRDFYRRQEYDRTCSDQLTADNSALLNNSVYAFAESARGLLWIGGDGQGLNYYSYADRRIRALVPDGPLRYVHALYESDPRTLWVATVGDGVYKLTLGGTDRPVVERIERIDFGDELRDKQLFFTLYPEDERTIWFGNRGGGALRYDLRTGESRLFDLSGGGPATCNDVFALCRDREGSMWFGTGAGVLRSTEQPTLVEGINSAIHGILEDTRGNLWFSSNRGLIKYNASGHGVVTYGYSYGLQTIEYSDGACFADKRHGTLLFGGINGVVVVSHTDSEETPYHPPILFRDVRINERIDPVTSRLNGAGELVLRHGERIFDISVSALDYINGSNYTYQSRLDGYGEHWQSGSGTLSFADLPPGRYRLDVRYFNNISGEYSPVESLRIRVRAVWYASVLAKVVYLLLAAGLAVGALLLYVRRYRRRRAEYMERLENRRREQQYESKLNLFSNLTQELSVPLTMISAPCQQIILNTGASGPVFQYAKTIQQNVGKLQNLVAMLYQFRDEHSAGDAGHIELVSVSELGAYIAETFAGFARQNSIECRLDIEPTLVWPTDKEGVSMILNTLLRNAFRHTPFRGEVRLTIRSEGDELLISVANNSKGVDLEAIQAVFDRYRVLDYFDKKSRRGQSISDDLGLAICHGIAERMHGSIAVESTPYALTTFTVRLPRLSVSAGSRESNIVSVAREFGLPAQGVVQRKYPFDPARQTIVIVNDNAEMMSFVAELFAADFNIKMFGTIEGVTDLLRQMHPDLIICDIISQRSDNLSLIGQVKRSKLTSHIPIILLSTPRQIDARIKGVESGADICLTLPFDVEYLKAVVQQLLRRNVQLKDYYKSSVSAFELSEGKMLHKDDKVFLDRMLEIIGRNLTNSRISTRFIADELGVSVRNLYRRIEGILQQTPTHIIKEYRLTTAEHLLVTTKLSIDEIIYKAGFVNRGTFFKCFSAKYGCTPKVYRKEKLSQIRQEVGEESEDAADRSA